MEDEGTKNTAVVSVTAARQIGYKTVSMQHPHFPQVSDENDDGVGKGGRERRDISDVILYGNFYHYFFWLRGYQVLPDQQDNPAVLGQRVLKATTVLMVFQEAR